MTNTSTPAEGFGATLRQARRSLGLSLTEAAAKAGIAASNACKLEHSEAPPMGKGAAEYARALGYRLTRTLSWDLSRAA